jgi:hypothetical protein
MAGIFRCKWAGLAKTRAANRNPAHFFQRAMANAALIGENEREKGSGDLSNAG